MTKTKQLALHANVNSSNLFYNYILQGKKEKTVFNIIIILKNIKTKHTNNN